MLDIKTGMLVLAVEALTLSVLLLALWLHDRGKRHYLSWGIGFAARAISVSLIAMRGHLPDYLSLDLGNAILLGSAAFWLAGLRQFDKRDVPPWVLLPVAIWLGGMQFPFVRDDIAYRGLLLGFATTLSYIMLAATTLSMRCGTRRYRQLLSGTWLVMAANLATVAVFVVIERPGNLLQVSVAPISGAVGTCCFIAIILFGAKILMDESQKRLRQLVRSDPLTGVLNRRGLMEAFEALKKNEVGNAHVAALLLFDLDHFKQINDQHGHEVGDRVLVAFSDIASSRTTAHGVFGRSGGEEFIAILQLADDREASGIAEVIRQHLAVTPTQTTKGSVAVTVSIGIAAMPVREADINLLMNRADKALYAAKAAGRNRTALAHEDMPVIVSPPDQGDEMTIDNLDDVADRQVVFLRRLAAIAQPGMGTSMR